MNDGIDSAAVTGGSTLFDLKHRVKDVKISNLQQWMKDNAAKIAEDVKTGELQQRMKINATKITGDVVTAYETIKESETLHSMTKESTLDKLLVGRGTFDLGFGFGSSKTLSSPSSLDCDKLQSTSTLPEMANDSFMARRRELIT